MNQPMSPQEPHGGDASAPTEADYATTLSQTRSPAGNTSFRLTYRDLPSCTATGATEEEARKKGKDAFAAWVAAARSRGIPVPGPGSADEAPSQYGIRFLREHRQRLERYAAKVQELEKKESFNGLVKRLLIEGVTRRGFQSEAEKHQATVRHLAVLRERLQGKRLPTLDPAPAGREKPLGWSQRLSSPLYHALSVAAQIEGVSLNTLIITILIEELAWRWSILTLQEPPP